MGKMKDIAIEREEEARIRATKNFFRIRWLRAWLEAHQSRREMRFLRRK